MRNLPRLFKGLVAIVVSFQMAACGTILYPERKGQRDGRLDVGVVVMDGIGLLLFIIPGVIAYAVDFSNGTIYLPRTSLFKTGLDRHELKTVKFDVKKYTPDLLRKIIREETGYDLDMQDKRLRVITLANKEDMAARFALAAQPAPSGTSLASSR